MEGEHGFDQWAVVELFGHQQIAGKVTEAQIGGGSFIRVDVPETTKHDGRGQPAFTKYFGPSAIYGITPCEERIAREAAQTIERYRNPVPVSVPAFQAPRPAPQPALIGSGEGGDGEWSEDDERHFDDGDLPL